MQSSDLILDDAQIVERFLASLYSKKTRECYSAWLNEITSDPSAFLKLARENRWKAQELLIDWIVSNRDKRAPISIRSMLASVKSLCDYAEIILSWKKIQKTARKVTMGFDDESAPFDGVQKIYSVADLRMKWIISLFMSGIRVGAFDDFRVKHLNAELLKVYAGEPEEYYALLTPEALSNWQAYREFRERNGEAINAESPLVRNVFDPTLGSGRVQGVGSGLIGQLIRKAWNDSGYRERNFKQCHGFRKMFRTHLTTAGMKLEDAEILIGHKDRPYYKPTLDYLRKEFAKYSDAVTLSDAFRAKKVIREKDSKISELTDALHNVRSEFSGEMESMRKQIAEMQRKQSSRRAGSEA